ncbi:MAG: aminotransferase class I/II-fold pyridoxal phosphate-dependent enzyme [Pseudomonadales bacterium]|jgi:cystathionine beta-lyase|nr:aminotransferase class I/II-fold pyridoxal phosphate-dependent enzyme [Pseudomonadales bacterium]
MSKFAEMDRRGFLRTAGMAALAGTAGGGSMLASPSAVAASMQRNGKFDFDEIYDRVGSNCVKWDNQIARFGEEHFRIGMGIADMDFRAAPAITKALEKRIQHENWGYLGNQDGLKEAIAMWSSERHGVEVDPSTLQIAAGVHPGLIAALHAFSPPGSKVLMMTPTYNGFYGDLRWSRTLANESPLWKDREGVYHIDWDDLEARMTPDTHAMLLCNPQNPTGNVWSREDLHRIGELCLKHEVVVLADEIHCDFIMDGQTLTPFASLDDKAIVDNSLTFKAISKTFSLAGMKNAYWFSTNPVLTERVKWFHRADINTLGVVANEAAYREGGPWFDQLLGYINANHDFAEAFILERIPKMKYKKAQGTYLAWVDVREVQEALGAEEMAAREGYESADHWFENWLVMSSGVQLNPGINYGPNGAGHMRMNIGSPRPIIEDALKRIEAAFANV